MARKLSSGSSMMMSPNQKIDTCSTDSSKGQNSPVHLAEIGAGLKNMSAFCMCSDTKIEALEAMLSQEKDLRTKLELQYQKDREALSLRKI